MLLGLAGYGGAAAQLQPPIRLLPPVTPAFVWFHGAWVAALPDVNGDGQGDFIVGAFHENPGHSASDNGRAYIYSGAGGRLVLRLLPPSRRADEYFGHLPAGVPRPDGRPDIVVGAPGEDHPGYGHAGAAYRYRY